MSTHITSEEMTELLMGVSTNASDSHLRTCEKCRTELDKVKSSITSFRTASHAWSQGAAARPAVIARSTGARSLLAGGNIWWRLAAVAALIVIIFSIDDSAPRQGSTTSNGSALTAQEQIAQDNELLSQINSEIAEGVPAPMQPLQISAADSSSKTNAQQ